MLRKPITAFGAMLAAVLCHPRQVSAADAVEMSFAPPKGLSVSETPQFIVLGFDDNRYIDGMTWVLDLLEGKKNPAGKGNPATFDGQSIKASFYYSTNAIVANQGDAKDVAYKADLLQLWKKTVADGYEFANHTHTHETSSSHSKEQWVEEIKNCTKHLVDLLGVDAKEIWGFRTPYLDFAKPTFDAIKETGLVYECTVTHQGEYNKKQHVWPYTLDKGFSSLASGPAAADWTYPGIWEIPVYTTSIDISGFPPVTGFDSSILTQAYGDKFDVMLKTGLDYRLAAGGNRAPYTVGLHSDTYSDENASAKVNYDPRMSLAARKKALSDFIDYALTKPDVRFVTAKQLIQWMRNPVALSDIKPGAKLPGSRKAVMGSLFKVRRDRVSVTLPYRGGYVVSVVSPDGRKLYSRRHVNAHDTRDFVTVATSELPRGVHWLRLEGMGVSQSRLLALP